MKSLSRVAHFWSLVAATCGVAAGTTHGAPNEATHTFKRQQLSDVYYSEGAGVGDLNRDGHADVVYGPYWFAGPDFAIRQAIYDPVPQNRERYADNFFSWVYDFNDDGWNDVLVAGFPGTPAYVYENPRGAAGNWPKHEVFDWVSNEAPQFMDLVGDDRPELVCTRDGYFGYVTVNWEHPFQAWAFRRISNQITAKQFGHGLGVGDVNGDGRKDVLSSTAWFEQPSDTLADGFWPQHEASFTDSYGGAEMYAYDVDGDGDNDVIASLAAHDFGLAWYEQVRENGQSSFKQHLIMGSRPEENRHGVVFSELHSVALADMDGDGLKDIITGKTFYSHHRQSPQWDAPAVVYWFQLVRGADGIDWVPHEIDREAGIGRQITVADLDRDGRPDVTVGGMKGCHVLLQAAGQQVEASASGP